MDCNIRVAKTNALIGFRMYMDRNICVAKTKALISFPITAKLICAFVYAYANS